MAKKKKEKDFKKVKLKVGRKLTRGENETKTDFKAKKIILKEAKSLGKDPIESLIKSSTEHPQLRMVSMNNLSNGYLALNPKLVSGQLVSVLARLLLDYDSRLRTEARKCILQCISSLEKAGLDLEPMMSILINFLKCGLTHINSDICGESRNLLKVLIPKLPSSLQGEFMATLMARFINGSHPDVVDYELSSTLLDLVRAEEHVSTKTVVREVHWNKADNYLNLQETLRPALRYDFSFKASSTEESKGKFMTVLSHFVEQELTQFSYRNEGNWTFTPVEARLFIAIAKISNSLECRKLSLQVSHPNVSVLVNTTLTRNKKQVALMSSYEDQINKFIPMVYLLGE